MIERDAITINKMPKIEQKKIRSIPANEVAVEWLLISVIGINWQGRINPSTQVHQLLGHL